MTQWNEPIHARVAALIETARRELHNLKRTDGRLFAPRLDAGVVATYSENDELAERVDAFVARFGRLQDTLGDKLLPAFLTVMQEIPGAALENLDRAERLGLLGSANEWASIRKLWNRMIHEYTPEPAELAAMLEEAHRFIPVLEAFLASAQARLRARFPPPPPS